MRSEKSAGAVIFYLHDKEPIFLMLKYPNYWGFVKGLIEPGEEEHETARREAKEEANLSKLKFVEGFKHIIKYFFKFKGEAISKEVVFFLAEVSREEAKKVKISHEHNDFQWLNFNSSIKIIKHKNEKEILEAADNFLEEYSKQKRLF